MVSVKIRIYFKGDCKMKKAILSACVLVGLMAMAAQATVIDTWTGTESTNVYTYNANAAPFPTNPQVLVQSFSVAAGQTGTKFEFYCLKGAYAQTDVYAVVQIYSKDTGSYIGAGTRALSDFEGTEGWVTMDGLNLAPGNYYAQMYPTNGGATWDAFAGKYYADSTYAGGSAAYGWGGGAAVAGDFQTRLTVVPEPFTLILMGIGCVLGVYRKI
jgi:hypothetical protein